MIHNKDAKICMKCPAPEAVGLLHLATAIKIWELDRISLYHPWELIH